MVVYPTFILLFPFIERFMREYKVSPLLGVCYDDIKGAA